MIFPEHLIQILLLQENHLPKHQVNFTRNHFRDFLDVSLSMNSENHLKINRNTMDIIIQMMVHLELAHRLFEYQKDQGRPQYL